MMVLGGLGWGVLPAEMFNQNPKLSKQLKVLNVLDFTPKLEYFIDLVWSRESNLGAAALFLINHLQMQRKQPNT